MLEVFMIIYGFIRYVFEILSYINVKIIVCLKKVFFG